MPQTKGNNVKVYYDISKIPNHAFAIYNMVQKRRAAGDNFFNFLASEIIIDPFRNNQGDAKPCPH